MDKSDRFKVVWSVLNALRAHDDRFEATVNKIELNRHKPGQILIGGVSGGCGESGEWEYSNGSSTSGGNVIQPELPFGQLNEMTYQIPRLFPTGDTKNLVICVSGVGLQKPFSCLITDITPDLELVGKSQCFPLWWYELDDSDSDDLFSQSTDSDRQDRYIRHDGITDWILRQGRTPPQH